MRVVRWFKCSVIGTGRVTEKKDDSYQPVIADLSFEHHGWSAIYYPDHPPYNFCVVRMEVEHDIPIPKAEELDVKGMRKLCDELPYFKHRWLDQPVYPVVRAEVGDKGSDPVETRYFRSDSHTINTVNAEKLLTTNTTTYKERSIDGAGTIEDALAYFITGQLGATKLGAATWTFHFWGRISTIGGGPGYYAARLKGKVAKIDSSGSSTSIGESDWTPDYGTSFSEQDVSWNCPETSLATTDAIHVTVWGWNEVYDTNWNFLLTTLYFRCGDSTYNSRITNFTWFVIKTISLLDAFAYADPIVALRTRLLGLLDAFAYADPIVALRTCLLGLLDAHSLADVLTTQEAYHRALLDAHSLTDAVSTQETYHRVLADAYGLADLFSTLRSRMLTLADAFALADVFATLKTRRLEVVDPYALADILLTQETYYRVLVDSYPLADIVATFRARPLFLADNYSLADVIAKQEVYRRIFVDGYSLSDLTSFQEEHYRTLTDAYALADPIATLRARRLVLADALDLADALSRSGVYYKTLVDGYSLADVATVAGAKFMLLTDAYALTDQISIRRNPALLAKLLSKLIRLMDIKEW